MSEVTYCLAFLSLQKGSDYEGHGREAEVTPNPIADHLRLTETAGAQLSEY